MRSRSLLFAGALLLLLSACNLPVAEQKQAEKACTVSVASKDARMRWYDGTTLVYVPAGEFQMGIQGGQDNPLHTIAMDDFWIYQNEVTNGMYAMCVAANGCTPPAADPALPDATDQNIRDHPMVGVTWAQADTYCKWMGARLPTEAEWEKTARGPSGITYPWGEAEPSCDRLNFNNCVGALTDVLSYPSGVSPYTAHDMAGNASEWVSDWYKASYYNESPKSNPRGPDTGTMRSLRGGSHTSAAVEVRSSTRAFEDPLKYRPDLGFRCVVLNAQCYAPACTVSALTWKPRTKPETPTCEPPPIEVTQEKYCQQKVPYVNINPHGAGVSLPSGEACHAEGDLYACTGDQGENFKIKVCTSCTPVAPAVPIEQPSCPAGYTYDEKSCSCKVVPSSAATNCGPIFSMLYVPAQQCCQPQAPTVPGRPPGLMVPADPGSLPTDCGTLGPPPMEPITKCEEVPVTLGTCGGKPPGLACVQLDCQSPSQWDSSQCCCAIRKKCQ